MARYVYPYSEVYTPDLLFPGTFGRIAYNNFPKRFYYHISAENEKLAGRLLRGTEESRLFPIQHSRLGR
jgi:hypothetical protein